MFFSGSFKLLNETTCLKVKYVKRFCMKINLVKDNITASSYTLLYQSRGYNKAQLYV